MHLKHRVIALWFNSDETITQKAKSVKYKDIKK